MSARIEKERVDAEREIATEDNESVERGEPRDPAEGLIKPYRQAVSSQVLTGDKDRPAGARRAVIRQV